jgi:hypothetical protein
MIILLYIVLSYLVVLGMILEGYSENDPPREAWLVFLLSPVTLPVIIGMMISKK